MTLDVTGPVCCRVKRGDITTPDFRVRPIIEQTCPQQLARQVSMWLGNKVSYHIIGLA